MKIIYALFAFFALTMSLQAIENYAVVNYSEVLQSSKAFVSFQGQIEKIKKDLETQFGKENDALKLAETNLAKERSDLSTNEFEKKRTEFEKKVEAFRVNVQTKQQSFDRIGAEVIKNIEDEIKKLIASEVKSKKYEVVYQAEGLAYYLPAKDISKEIIRQLDKSLPTVTVKKP
ncbi:OmpH family outer membrane protein [Candidatus Hepatincolaceae symbiont of Richtersius coronifer]